MITLNRRRVYGESGGYEILWNQLFKLSPTAAASVQYSVDADEYVTINGTATSVRNVACLIHVDAGHKYVTYGKIISGSYQGTPYFQIYAAGNMSGTFPFENVLGINTAILTGNCQFRFHQNNGDVFSYLKMAVNVFDVTLMFGEGKEPTSAGSFVEWLEDNFGSQDKFLYNTGEIIKVKSLPK